MKRFFQVVLPLPVRQSFTYSLPETISAIPGEGMRVIVPFGNREVMGYIAAEIKESEICLKDRKIKDIIRLLDEESLIDAEILKLCRWASDYYLCGFGEMMKAALPSFMKRSSEKIERSAEIIEKEGTGIEQYRELCRNAVRQRAVLELLFEEHKPLTLSEIKDQTGAGASVVVALQKKGLIKMSTKRVKRKPFILSAAERKEFVLSHEQEAALEEISRKIVERAFQVFLLKGVTGSGKTEVYLRAIERAINMGKDALYLVPEISLTPLLAREIKAWFGNSVAILHSSLTQGERYDEWMRVQEGEAKIVLGARSAVFAPLKNIGIIIIDEEQDHSYKQEESPRYNARDLAIVRAQFRNIPVILGSATPSLESYAHAQDGKYRLLEMRSRVEKRALPDVEIVDMKEEFKKTGEIDPLSGKLLAKIREKIGAGEQVLLLLNRRGFSSFIQCRECGNSVSCPRCSISLTYHRESERLLCHYCGYWKKKPERCPHCSSERLFFGGEGTEKIENVLKEELDHVRIARMDSDTVRGRGGHARVLGAFERREIDLLVGTQMIAKGHDFPSVTLVGVISADHLLAFPDFRASERTFQLITQVSGRAGRGEIPGLVIVQAYQSGHHAIQTAVQQDFEAFYAKEIRFRRIMKYPPFTFMANIIILDKDLSRGAGISKKAGRLFKQLADGRLTVLGPAVAPIARIRKNYRFQIVLKARHRKDIGETLNRFLEKASGTIPLRNLIIDVDPLSLM